MKESPSANTQAQTEIHFSDYVHIIRSRWREIFITCFLVVITAAGAVSLLPRKYDSMCQIEVVKPGADLNVLADRGNLAKEETVNDEWMGTQFGIITASETLKRVNKKLSLAEKWSESETQVINKLKNIIKTEQVRGQNLINITVRHTNPQETQSIALEVANAYKERRDEERDGIQQTALKRYDEQLKEAENQLEEKTRILASFAEQHGYRDVSSSNSEGQPTRDFEKEDYQRAKEQLQSYETEQRKLESQIAAIGKMQDDSLVNYAMGSDMPDSAVKRLHPTLQDRQRELDSLRAAGFGAKHQKVLQMQKEIQNLQEQLAQAVVDLRSTMQDRLALLGRNIESERASVKSKGEKWLNKSKLDSEFKKVNDAKQELEKRVVKMKDEYQTQQVRQNMTSTAVKFQEYPTLPEAPSWPKVPWILGAALVFGLILGFVLAFFLEYMDTSVKTMDEVERLLELPVLGVIPTGVGLLLKTGAGSADAEAYRILRTNLEFNRKNAGENAITMVSGGAGEGKSTTLCNLAYICASGGYSTLIIDADLRRPRMHVNFDVDNSVGLSTYLTQNVDLENVVIRTKHENLYFIPSGEAHEDAAGILNSQRMSQLIQESKKRFDLVFVDAPPILGVSDSAVIVSEVDLTIIVVQHRKLPKQLLMRVKQIINMVGGKALGVVLNNVDLRSDQQYYYYTSYYTYYSSDYNSNKKKSAAAPKPDSSAKPALATNTKTSTPANDELY